MALVEQSLLTVPMGLARSCRGTPLPCPFCVCLCSGRPSGRLLFRRCCLCGGHFLPARHSTEARRGARFVRPLCFAGVEGSLPVFLSSATLKWGRRTHLEPKAAAGSERRQLSWLVLARSAPRSGSSHAWQGRAWESASWAFSVRVFLCLCFPCQEIATTRQP